MADQLKEDPIMRKKLLALSIALLTIGGSLTFTSVARADVSPGLSIIAAICAGENALLFYNG